MSPSWATVGFSNVGCPVTSDFVGYGTELADPDGYLIRLWDEQSMKDK